MTKILLGLPVATDSVKAFFMSCVYGLGRVTEHQMDVCIGSSSIVSTARNNLVDVAIRDNYSHIMFLDCDMVFPPDTVMRLLAHNKDIVAALYRRRRPPYEVLGHCKNKNQVFEGDLVEMSFVPTGVLLVRTAVFSCMKKPWFRLPVDEVNGFTASEDYMFCQDARSKGGYSIWADPKLSAEVGHIAETIIYTKEEGPKSSGLEMEEVASQETRFDARLRVS